VHIRVPVNGIECAQGMKEFIGGRNYIGLQQPKEAEAFVIGVPCTYRRRLHGYVVRRHLDYSSNPAFTALPVSVKTIALVVLLEENHAR
jgi:hypothetical protein